MMPQTHWREADRATFARAWEAEVADVPEFTDSEIHIVAGLLLPIWKRLPNESTRVYRLQTDAGERIIGRKVSPAWVASALEAGTSSLSPDAAFAALIDGKTILDLAEGLQVRRVRVMGVNRIEVAGFDDTMRDRLRAYGLFGEIISWKLRFFVPVDASGPAILAKVLECYPIARIADRRRRDMPRNAAELAHRLAREAEAVCRHYLSNGRRVGNYWLVGDVRNTSGRSMFVRLKPKSMGGRPAGKWTDAATGEHGDLLDVIRESCGLVDFRDVADEARRFLSLPRSEPKSDSPSRLPPVPTGSPESARRLFGMSQPVAGTVVETYLRGRGITYLHGIDSLRYHPRCYYRPEADAPTEIWPAMIAAVTDLQGHITGAHRTWLDPSGRDKAPVDTPRRAMGLLLGHAIRIGTASDVMAAGEGIETMLSLRCVMPTMAMVAALSAAHLRAILFPAALRRLYIVRDDDRAGDSAMNGLIVRTRTAGIEAMVLSAQLGDFNEDLRNSNATTLRAALQRQFAPQDVTRFL